MVICLILLNLSCVGNMEMECVNKVETMTDTELVSKAMQLFMAKC